MAGIIEDILKRVNPKLKYEDLNYDEREQITKWMKQLSTKELTIEEVKGHIRNFINAVENELIDTDEFIYTFIFKRPNRKHIYLKARLKNYLLIEALLTSTEKAKKAIEKYLTKET